LTKAGKVWRGIKDAKLPKEFWVANEMGVRGGIEYGFSSTTTDKAQALAYASGGGMGKSGDAMTIFEMQMGMVDRGADRVRQGLKLLAPALCLAVVCGSPPPAAQIFAVVRGSSRG